MHVLPSLQSWVRNLTVTGAQGVGRQVGTRDSAKSARLSCADSAMLVALRNPNRLPLSGGCAPPRAAHACAQTAHECRTPGQPPAGTQLWRSTHLLGCNQYSKMLCAYGQASPKAQRPSCGAGGGCAAERGVRLCAPVLEHEDSDLAATRTPVLRPWHRSRRGPLQQGALRARLLQARAGDAGMRASPRVAPPRAL